MRLLVFGRTGQVATELGRLAGPGLDVTALGRDRANLADADACAAIIAGTDADVVINAAAYTAVDRAEEEEALATAINAAAPGAMARASAEKGLPFLHISTDYVFDGSKEGAWVEDDLTAPLGAYGRSKLAGEEAVRAAGGAHVILRTAWVFSGTGSNFVKTMLGVGRDRDRLTVVDDQRGGPTSAGDIAAALVTIARAFHAGRGSSGTFHFAGRPTTTWCGFAREIFARTGWEKGPEIVPITTADWPTPARRPVNSALDCSKILAAYGIAQPDWQAALDALLKELS